MEQKLVARTRKLTGKGGARRIRAQGEVPAIIYGLGLEPRNLAVKTGDVWDTIQGEAGLNVLIDLQVVDGKEKDSQLVMIKEVQKHPFKEKILHVDFLRVARDEKVTMKVPITLVGQEDSVGLKEGGTLQHTLWEVEIECLPADIPDELPLDISELDIGDNIRVSDLVVPGEVKMTADPEDVIVTVLAPRLLVEEEEEEEELTPEEMEALEAEEEMAPGEETPEEGAPPPGGEEE